MAQRRSRRRSSKRPQRDYRPGERPIVRPQWFSEIHPVGVLRARGSNRRLHGCSKGFVGMSDPMAKRKPSKEETRGAGPSAPGQPGHDEWLLDESVEESFPASDPVSPSRPGSTLAKRYQTTKKPAKGRSRRRTG
jgi:hypothetical protein